MTSFVLKVPLNYNQLTKQPCLDCAQTLCSIKTWSRLETLKIIDTSDHPIQALATTGVSK